MIDDNNHEGLATIRALLLGGEDGVEQWNALREQESKPPSLDTIDLSKASFSQYFRRTNFRRVSFRHAILRDSDLDYTDLGEADFTSATLTNVRFGGQFPATLNKTRFDDAHLESASFRGASLEDVTFRGASATDANFRSTRCTRCDFQQADLRRAALERSVFQDCDLHGANLTGATLGGGAFLNSRLPEAAKLEAITHAMPTRVDWSTLCLGRGRIPPSFLVGLGLPQWLALASLLLDPDLTEGQFIPLDVAVGQNADQSPKTAAGRPTTTAFASYSSLDAQDVTLCLSALSRWDVGLTIFTDCLDLKPNEPWRQQLERVIPQQDCFFLFWSANAMKSKWVDWEWRHASATKGIDAIRPFPLDDPASVPPPPELEHLHFGDRYLLAREARSRIRT